jgi:hypothetical protein
MTSTVTRFDAGRVALDADETAALVQGVVGSSPGGTMVCLLAAPSEWTSATGLHQPRGGGRERPLLVAHVGRVRLARFGFGAASVPSP